MKKNGFISISVVYSFFLVFLMVLVAIITSYANNRLLTKDLKDEIIKDIDSKTTKLLSTYLIENADTYNLINHNDTLNNGAKDNSLRFVGANPNNYICFGTSDKSTCLGNTSKYMYRIIGIFKNEAQTKNLIKIIKADYLTTSLVNSNYASSNTYYWGGTNTNTSNNWSFSSLNNKGLNVTFYNGFSAPWHNLMLTWEWNKGGINYSSNMTNAYTTYSHEVGISADNTSKYLAKIGLMYASDYMYAVSSNRWSTSGTNYSSIKSENWLYKGSNEWTITKNNANENNSLMINSNGNITQSSVNIGAAIRPCFYLDSEIFITNVIDNNVIGSISNPFTIS